MTFLDCPAYLSHDGQTRCGLPAEIINRYTLPSTDEPVECATIRCPSPHRFNGRSIRSRCLIPPQATSRSRTRHTKRMQRISAKGEPCSLTNARLRYG